MSEDIKEKKGNKAQYEVVIHINNSKTWNVALKEYTIIDGMIYGKVSNGQEIIIKDWTFLLKKEKEVKK